MSRIRIVAIRLLCPAPSATAAFYAEAFGARIGQDARGVVVSIGAQRVELRRTAAQAGGPAPSNSTAFQHCALVVPDMEAAMRRLGEARGWTAISQAGPEQLPASSGGVRAFKFRDPDGHPLEFLWFPADRRPPGWWEGGAGPVLGIDHTAIAVSETERSVAFYAGLGFRVASRGVNRGIEQGRMDGLDDPLVEVTALAPPGGGPPHLELLCYRQPPVDTVALDADDVLATRIVLMGQPDGANPDIVDPDGHRLIFAAADQ